MKITNLNFSNKLKALKPLKVGKKTRLAVIVGLVGIAGFAGFAFWSNRASAAEYMTAKVERGNLRNTVTATGVLQAVTTVQVGSQASGTISALYADFNSVVKKGQVIAQLDPSTAQAQVQQARANLESAKASLIQARAGVSASRAGTADAQAKVLAAKSTVQTQQAGVSGAQANLNVLKAERDDAMSALKQQEALASAGVISKRDYEIAQTAYRTADARYNQAAAQLSQAMLNENMSAGSGQAQAQAQLQQSQAQIQQAQAQVLQAEAQVQQAQAALSVAEVNLSHTTITSPIDGIVVSRDINVGQTVAASLSAPTLFTIANDLTKMQVIANIDQADIGLVEQAKTATFGVDAFPGKEFKGAIQQMRLNPQNVQNVVTYNVVLDVDNPEQKLKPGMTANLTITIDERNNVLKVPNAALRFRPQTANTQNRSNNGDNNGGQRQNRGQRSADGNGDQANRQENRLTPSSAPVIAGQNRLVWIMGADGKPQPRRITVGLSDGSATEIVSGNLQEGDVVIIGETISGQARTQTTQTAPGFGGGGQRGGLGGGARR
ncbi:MAG TPA: efflux RND transporter periplasmic adaptor subunit [Pyrinomonadaceae bacterium]|nr:efflux RND transporter periplasmic adaptor subunit [Pyrinomonadaceae bacterium]